MVSPSDNNNDASHREEKAEPVSAQVTAPPETEIPTLSVSDSQPDATQAHKTENPQPKATSPSKKAPWLSVLLLLLMMGLATAGGWLWLQVQHLQQQVSNLPDPRSVVRDDVRRLQQQIHTIETSQQAFQRSEATFEKRIRQLQQQQTAFQSHLNELSNTDRADWQLAEVEYLLRLAHQRLMSSQRTELAIELMIAADDKLKQLARADLWSVREQVARDIVALQMTGVIDIDGLYLQLHALSEELPQLNFQIDTQQRLASFTAPAEDVPAAEGWKDTLMATWQKVLSLYRVQKREIAIAPLLTEEQVWLLKQRVHLSLLQAQQALLTRDVAVFEASLSHALQMMQTHALANDDRNNAFVSQLQQLQSQPIRSELPDISGSHTVLTDYMRAYRLAPQDQPQ